MSKMIQIPVEPQITDYLHRKAAKLKLPLSGTFELTPVCNMNCRMCYVRMSREQQEAIAPLRTAEEWLALGREAKEAGLVYLLLTGGEPFLRKDFRQILTGLHRMGFVISVNTNGTLIDEDAVAWLKEAPPVRMNITLYGASDETYARLCQNPHGFTQATHAIELLQAAGIAVKINCSVTPYNAKDLPDIFRWAREHHLVVQATSYMFPPVRKDASKVGTNDRFEPEEAAYYSASIVRYLNGDDEFVRRYENRELRMMTGQEDDCLEVAESTNGEGGEPIRCRAGKCTFWVTWDGRFLPCGMFEGKKALNVFQSGVAESWKAAVAEAAEIRLPAGCASCPAKEECKTCAAMVYCETGCYHIVPEYRCRMARAYPGACEQVYREIMDDRQKET